MDLPLVIESSIARKKSILFAAYGQNDGRGLVTLEKQRFCIIVQGNKTMNELTNRFNPLESGEPSAGYPREHPGRSAPRIHSETGTIHLLDAEKQLLITGRPNRIAAAMLGIVQTIPVGKGIAGQVAAENRPVTICNFQRIRPAWPCRSQKNRRRRRALCADAAGGNLGGNARHWNRSGIRLFRRRNQFASGRCGAGGGLLKTHRFFFQ